MINNAPLFLLIYCKDLLAGKFGGFGFFLGVAFFTSGGGGSGWVVFGTGGVGAF